MRTITLLITIFSLSLPAYAKYSGGTGEPDDPYQIATATDLIALGETPEDYDKHFILTADIDLDPNLPGLKVFDKAVIAATDYSWDQGFTGVFYGNGHMISHMTIAGENYLGLFGRLGDGAMVSSLSLEAVDVHGTSDYVGGLIGYNTGSVIGSSSTGTVTGESNVGGLVGDNGGEVIYCYSMSTVSGVSSVGGLLGGSQVYGKVSTGGRGNPLVFIRLYPLAAQCYSTSTVTGEQYVGGLAGENGGEITNCYSMSVVNGSNNVGGLVGLNMADYDLWDVGGVIDGQVARCYSTGAVSGTGWDVGGLVGGHNDGGDGYIIIDSFWDIETSGQRTSAGGRGLTTTEMKKATTFTSWAEDGVWTIDNEIDYPHLRWESASGEPITRFYYYGGGGGSRDDPYLICSAEQLNTIGLISCDWNKHFKLMTDVDMSGLDGMDGRPNFHIIGTSYHNAFIGVFDGNGHTISHLTIDGDSFLGLFTSLEPRGEVNNLGVVDVNITGSGSNVGGLVGSNAGTITQCYSTGTVKGDRYVGGLTGGGGDITVSYSTATVTGNEYVGGLVGENRGSVIQCFSTGMVSGEDYVGGLIGRNRYGSNISLSYSSGPVTCAGRYIGGLVGYNEGSVIQCFNIGAVSGRHFVGGLVGNNHGTVEDCYSTSSANGDSEVGGLVGSSYGYVISCFSTSAVSGNSNMGGLFGWNSGSVSNNFWDIQVSGQTKSSGGTGKTTAEMRTARTFLDAGWDFVDETENGIEDIWWILEGQDYPQLWWEAE